MFALKSDVIISVINKFYGNDKTKRIDDKAFLSYAKNHTRFRGCHSTRLGDKCKSTNAMWFDVTGMEEYADFGSMIEPMSYNDLKNGQEGNNM